MYSLLMHAELQTASNKNKGLIYWKSQDGVYLGGSGSEDTIRKEPPEMIQVPAACCFLIRTELT